MKKHNWWGVGMVATLVATVSAIFSGHDLWVGVFLFLNIICMVALYGARG